MKKFLCIFLCVMLFFSLFSCNKEKEPSPAPIYDVKKINRDIIFDEKDRGDITLLYIKLEDHEKASELLLDIAERHCRQKLPNLSSYEDGMLPEVTYEIESIHVTYLSASFLSARVNGTLTVSLAHRPEPFVYTINLDLDNNTEITSADIVKNFDAIKSLFTSGKFDLAQGRDGLENDTTLEDMIMQYRSEYEIYPYFHFTKDKLFMNIELVYALGSNALYSIDISDVKKHLNKISEIIR